MTEVIEGEAVEVGQDLELRPDQPVNLFRTENPGEIVARATEMANALAEVVREKKLTKDIKGKQHVLVQGWTLLGTMLGVFPVCVWTRKLEDGWEARVEARTLAGAVVGAAEAQCTRAESLWKSRDDYALRSMAQTRATSKALRQPLDFVMTLAGFESTPAEEMPREDDRIDDTLPPEDERPTTEQWTRMSELISTLEEKLPTSEGQLSWDAEAHALARHKFSKTPEALTSTELDVVLADFERRLEEADIPFG